MNPMDMIKAMMGKMTPEQMVMNMMGKSNNPMMQQLAQMAKQGNSQGLESFARNVCKEKGVDFDKEFQSFMTNFKE